MPDRPGRPINLADPGGTPPRRRFRWWMAAAAATAVVLAAAGFVFREPLGRGVSASAGGIGRGAEAVWDAWAAWGTSLGDRAEAVPEAPLQTTVPDPPPAESRSLLVVLGGPGGRAAFALAVQPPEGSAHLVMIPQTLLVQVPGYGEFTMAEALEFGGSGLARTALANQTGIRIDDVADLSGLEAVGDVVVDVPVELFVVEEDGSRRIITAGTQRLEPDLVELLLTEPGTGDQFDWLRRQEAAWEGVLAALAGDPGAAAGLAAGAAEPGAAADLVTSVAAGGSIGTPPVHRVAMGGSRDALVLASERIDDYLEGTLGHLLIRRGRPRVEILNGNGTAGSTISVAEALVDRGFYVFRTANADRFDYHETRVIAQGEEATDAAREAAEVLGAGEVLLEARAPSLVVDLSIIVGTDLAPMEG
jgi:hypothetical protein